MLIKIEFYLILFVLIFIVEKSFGQVNPNLYTGSLRDSVLIKLDQAEGTERLELLCSISDYYYNTYQDTSSNSGLIYLRELGDLSRSLDDSIHYAHFLRYMALKERSPESILMLKEAYFIFSRHAKDKSHEYKVLKDLAFLYLNDMKDYTSAERAFREILPFYKSEYMFNWSSTSHFDVCFAYLGMIMTYLRKKDFLSSIALLEEAKLIFENHDLFNNFQNAKHLLSIYNTLYGVYWMEEGDFENALNFFMRALRSSDKQGYTTDFYHQLLCMAQCYSNLGNRDSAKNYLEEASSLKTSLIESQPDSCTILNTWYEANYIYYQSFGEFEKALKYLELKTECDEQQVERWYYSKASEIMTLYEIEKRQKEITTLKKNYEIMKLQVSRQNSRTYTAIAVLLLICLLGRLRYLKKSKQRQKQNIMKRLEINEFRSRFMANVSHELRTPLSLVKLPIADFLNLPYLQPKDIEMLGLINNNVKRLHDLVDQLTDLSKFEVDALKLELKDVDILETLRIAISSFHSKAIDRNIEFGVILPDYIPMFYCDKEKIETVVYNLLSNSFKFTEIGGRISFIVKWEARESTLSIFCDDDGLGIPKEEHDQIFERFYKASNTRKKQIEGTGIGLALCKELVTLMGGDIGVKSDGVHGSRFYVKIPIKLSEKPDQHVKKFRDSEGGQTEERVVDRPKHNHHNLPTCILIEDDDDLRNYLKIKLSELYVVYTASNGDNGWKLIKEKQVDIVISDFMLPKMNGLELCIKLRADEAVGNIPFILLTAKSSQEDRLKGLEYGVDAYLAKPFNYDELKFIMTNTLQRRKSIFDKYEQLNDIFEKEVVLNSADEEFLKRLNECMEKYFSDNSFNVEKLADEIDMNPITLKRKIKSLTGLPTVSFMRNYRLNHAKKLLHNKVGNIKEIANQSGFNNVSYFSKVFKDRYGKLPSEFI